jgi:hypothetical protein
MIETLFSLTRIQVLLIKMWNERTTSTESIPWTHFLFSTKSLTGGYSCRPDSPVYGQRILRSIDAYLIHRRPMTYCHRLRDSAVRPIGQWYFSWSVPELIPLDRNVIPTKVNREPTFHFWTYRESITLTLTRRRESITFKIVWKWMIETNLLMDRTRATAPPSLDYCGLARTAWMRIYLIPAPSVYHLSPHLLITVPPHRPLIAVRPSARPIQSNPFHSINHLPPASCSITPSSPISQPQFASSINHCQFSSSVSQFVSQSVTACSPVGSSARTIELCPSDLSITVHPILPSLAVRLIRRSLCVD